MSEKLPHGWKNVRLESLGKHYGGLTNKTKVDFGHGKPYIPYMNIFSNSYIDPNDLELVSVGGKEHQSRVQYGDLFFTTSSETPDEVGMTSVLLNDLGEAYLNSFCFGFRLQNFETLLPEFAAFLFRGKSVRKSIADLAQGSTRYNLSKSIFFEKLILNLPPLPHQRKIARILSTVDGLIGKTEAAIAKYQAIKQGMMHDLFTRGIGADGRLRPAFADAPGLYRETAVGWVPREWEVVRMENHTVSSAFGPRFPATAYDEKGNIATLRTTDMDLYGNVNYKSMPLARLNENLFKEHILEEGDLLISRSGTIGVTALFKKFDVPVLPAAFLIRFRLSNTLSTIYLKNYFTWEHGRKRLVDLAEGGVQKNLRGSSVLKMFVQVPTREEQDKVVEKLEQIEKNLTSEIESLHKLHTLKQGLMQDLLTGRVGVKVEEG